MDCEKWWFKDEIFDIERGKAIPILKELLIQAIGGHQEEEFSVVLELGPDNIPLNTTDLDRAYIEVQSKWEELDIWKRKADWLKRVLKRLRERRYNYMFLFALNDKEFYPNQSSQKTFAESAAEEEARLLTESVWFAGAVHDDRQRLFNFRQDLKEIGNNMRRAQAL